MIRASIFALFLFSGACATGGAGPRSVAVPQASDDPARMAEFEERAAEQSRRIGELEARIALLEQEARLSRPEPASKPTAAVRIGRGRRGADQDEDDSSADTSSFSDDAQYEDGEASGPVPSLRLVGGDTGDDARPWAPPPLPSGLAGSLSVAPLPTAADTQEPPRVEVASASDATARYRAALRLVHERSFPQALAALGDFLDAFPGDPLADDAMYWRGEVHYAERRYRAALDEFAAVLTRFPDGGRVPEALLKLGMCHRRLGDSVSAGNYFRRLRQQYPDTAAARLVPEEGPS